MTTAPAEWCRNIFEEPDALSALKSGFKIKVQGMAKVKRRATAVRYAPRILPITKEQFTCATMQ